LWYQMQAHYAVKISGMLNNWTQYAPSFTKQAIGGT
jgi:hypothetical protein